MAFILTLYPARGKALNRLNNCVACGRCLKLCPQGLDIPKHLKEIAVFAKGA
jgi:predicted aldo/keto reductase-like oxidoreductase